MSEEDLDVKSAETTAPAEESTVEEQTEEAPTSTPEETPADASVEPEAEAKTVPYERFKEVNDRAKALEAEKAQAQVPSTPEVPRYENSGQAFEPETEQALSNWYAKQREVEKDAEFQRKHTEELKDPIVASLTSRLIAEGNAKGQYVDQEAALSEATKMIEERLKPRVDQAKKDGEEEGQEVARAKQQSGAVGDTSVKAEVKSDDQLSADEYAAKLGLKRVN